MSSKVVLAIAGSDSSAGAGIAADIKTGGAFGVFVTTAITALTAQSPAGVHGLYPTAPEQLKAQLQAATEVTPVDAVKIGMIGSEANLRVIAEFLEALLKKAPNTPVVLDPVLGATSGASLWQGDAPEHRYKDALLPLCSLITPNTLEAAKLLGQAPAEDYDTQQKHAKALLALGPKAVLVKGGHNQTPLATDYLALAAEQGPDSTPKPEPEIQPFSNARMAIEHSHGSGCTLATAIAAGLAQGLTLKQSVAAAKSYIHGALKNSARLALAPNNGPIHHFYNYW